MIESLLAGFQASLLYMCVVALMSICGVVIAVYAGLVLLGSHLSGTILILCIGVTMLFLGEVRGKWFAIGGVGGVAGLVLLYQTGILALMI